MALSHITRSELDDAVVLGPVGEFDISNVDMLRTTFLEAVSPEHNRIVIDLSLTEFVDSMAIGAMLGIARRANGWGGWVRLVAPDPTVKFVATYSAGLAADWNGIPEPLRLGIVRLVSHFYSHRDAPDAGGVPAAVAALWRPWRRMRLGSEPQHG